MVGRRNARMATDRYSTPNPLPWCSIVSSRCLEVTHAQQSPAPFGPVVNCDTPPSYSTLEISRPRRSSQRTAHPPSAGLGLESPCTATEPLTQVPPTGDPHGLRGFSAPSPLNGSHMMNVYTAGIRFPHHRRFSVLIPLQPLKCKAATRPPRERVYKSAVSLLVLLEVVWARSHSVFCTLHSHSYPRLYCDLTASTVCCDPGKNICLT